MDDLTWNSLDELVETDPLKLRDIAFALLTERAELNEKLRALAACEEFIGESCGNASHNVRALLAGDDPRKDARQWGLEF